MYVIANDELYHHGIKGQKWGIRRYQNEDGSLTPEGLARYSGEAGLERRWRDSQKTARKQMTFKEKFKNDLGIKSGYEKHYALTKAYSGMNEKEEQIAKQRAFIKSGAGLTALGLGTAGLGALYGKQTGDWINGGAIAVSGALSTGTGVAAMIVGKNRLNKARSGNHSTNYATVKESIFHPGQTDTRGNIAKEKAATKSASYENIERQYKNGSISKAEYEQLKRMLK